MRSPLRALTAPLQRSSRALRTVTAAFSALRRTHCRGSRRNGSAGYCADGCARGSCGASCAACACMNYAMAHCNTRPVDQQMARRSSRPSSGCSAASCQRTHPRQRVCVRAWLRARLCPCACARAPVGSAALCALLMQSLSCAASSVGVCTMHHAACQHAACTIGHRTEHTAAVDAARPLLLSC